MRNLIFAVLTVLPLFVIVPAVQAQNQSALPPGLEEELRQLKQEIDALKGQVAAIQRQALESHPDLAQQREDLARLIRDTADERGFDATASKQRLEELQQRYKSGDLSPQEKQQVASEFESEREALQNAQQQILKDENVVAARGRFAKDISAAMAEEDPRAEALIEELKALTEEFRQALMAALQRQRGG
ncbi:MAG: hypothetical protein U5S82_11025 [Gammaproteobacteria bacterium]|nr:hypothetical protein [Gammaproteobacteria bacterium]